MRNALKAVCFCLVFIVLFTAVTGIMTLNWNEEGRQAIPGFYREPKDSLDAVYIGASNVYWFWSAPLAWHNYGIKVYPFASGNLPFVADKYVIEEIRKTQPNALIIIGVNNSIFETDFVEPHIIHSLTDFIPMSLNKIRMVSAICNMNGFTVSESLEYFFSLIRYHERWKELSAEDFAEYFDVKGSCTIEEFLTGTLDVTEYKESERRDELPGKKVEMLLDTLDYCKDNDVRLLVVVSNTAMLEEDKLARLNTLADIVEENGFPVLRMEHMIDDIGLDLSKDYYQEVHVNVHGMIKTTDFLSKYLISNYAFADRRNEDGSGDWDQAYDRYTGIISRVCPDFEYDGSMRDCSVDAPALTAISSGAGTVRLEWEGTAGADGYRIYRRSAGANWTPLQTVPPDSAMYEDDTCAVGGAYDYTVVPFKNTASGLCWGDYDYNGLSVLCE